MDDSFGALIDKLTTMDEGQWLEVGQFYAGDHLIMEAPCQQLAWMMLLDAVHHRGQLSTYLRPMGSKVPSIYGPSADDQGEGHRTKRLLSKLAPVACGWHISHAAESQIR